MSTCCVFSFGQLGVMLAGSSTSVLDLTLPIVIGTQPLKHTLVPGLQSEYVHVMVGTRISTTTERPQAEPSQFSSQICCKRPQRQSEDFEIICRMFSEPNDGSACDSHDPLLRRVAVLNACNMTLDHFFLGGGGGRIRDKRFRRRLMTRGLSAMNPRQCLPFCYST